MLCCTTRLRVAPVCAQWRSRAAASAGSRRTESIVLAFVIRQPIVYYKDAVRAMEPYDQMPNSSLSVRAVVPIDCALARSSALFFGVEKPWPVPL